MQGTAIISTNNFYANGFWDFYWEKMDSKSNKRKAEEMVSERIDEIGFHLLQYRFGFFLFVDD